MTILLLDKINSFYGKNHVLRDISLKVIKKEIVSILGKNGAGKSTIIKSIIGTQPITKGDVYLYDTQITKLESHKIVRKGIGILNQGNSVFPTLTVLENIMLGHQNNKNNREEYAFYVSTGFQREFNPGNGFFIVPSFSVGLYNEFDHGKDMGFPLEFKSEIEFNFITSKNLIVGVTLNHISNAGLGSKNPGSDSIFVGFKSKIN